MQPDVEAEAKCVASRGHREERLEAEHCAKAEHIQVPFLRH